MRGGGGRCSPETADAIVRLLMSDPSTSRSHDPARVSSSVDRPAEGACQGCGQSFRWKHTSDFRQYCKRACYEAKLDRDRAANKAANEANKENAMKRKTDLQEAERQLVRDAMERTGMSASAIGREVIGSTAVVGWLRTGLGIGHANTALLVAWAKGILDAPEPVDEIAEAVAAMEPYPEGIDPARPDPVAVLEDGTKCYHRAPVEVCSSPEEAIVRELLERAASDALAKAAPGLVDQIEFSISLKWSQASK